LAVRKVCEKVGKKVERMEVYSVGWLVRTAAFWMVEQLVELTVA
jgi:hypothetical protein